MALLCTRRGELSNWKGCAAANGSRNAVFAAFLAQDGITGPSDVFEGKYGLWDVVGRFDWQFSVGDGAPHRVTQSHMKCFPLVYHAQPVAWVGLDARPRLRVQDISEIEIETYRLAVEMNGTDPSRWAPQTRETADHSIPYLVAAVLVARDFNDDVFSDMRLRDPRILGLLGKLELKEDADLTRQFPGKNACRIEVLTRSGERKVSQTENASGHYNNPMTDEEVCAKFRNLARCQLSAPQIESALGALWQLDTTENLDAIFEAVKTGP